MNDPTPESARTLLWRHGLPEDVIDGALCLHAQELAAVQRDALKKTDDPVFYEGEAGWLVDLIEPAAVPAVSSAVPEATPHAGRAADEPEVVHACPPDGSGTTPCCNRTPFELPATDRMSSDPVAVTCALEPTSLRWGLNDVLWGDDDSVIVMLSGPDREPYWLELDPERAAVLRQDLAGPDGEEPPADRAAVLREAAEAQPAKPDQCPHGCDVSTCPCLACEADDEPAETAGQDNAEVRVYAWAQTIDTADGGQTVRIPGVHHTGPGPEATAIIVGREDVPVLAAMLAAEAPEPAARAEARQTVEYFLQARQPDGSWEDGRAFMDDRAWAEKRLAVKRSKFSEFEWRMAQRVTTVVAQPVTAPAVVSQPETQAALGLTAEPLARLLAGARVLGGTPGALPFDDLPPAEQDRYRAQARDTLARIEVLPAAVPAVGQTDEEA